MSDPLSISNIKVVKFFKQYDGKWLNSFLFSAFGKYRYVHTLSERGLDCYLSNLRSVSTPHPDDVNCVSFFLTIECEVGGHSTYLFNMVDFKDPDVFINTFKKYLKLKAFL